MKNLMLLLLATSFSATLGFAGEFSIHVSKDDLAAGRFVDIQGVSIEVSCDTSKNLIVGVTDAKGVLDLGTIADGSKCFAQMQSPDKTLIHETNFTVDGKTGPQVLETPYEEFSQYAPE